MDETRFEISRDARRQAFLIAIGLFLLAALLIGVVVFELTVLERSYDLVLLLAPVVCIVLALPLLQFARRPDRYAVVITGDAIQIGARRIPWSEIDGLRARQSRIDLLQRGDPVASVRHDLDDLPHLTGLLVKHVRFADEPLPRVLGERPGLFAFAATILFHAAAASFGVWMLFQGRWFGALVLGGVPIVAATSFLKGVQQVELGEDGIRLRFLAGSRRIPRADLRGFDVLAVENNVRAVAVLEDDEFVELKVPGVDPFRVLRAARDAYPDLVA